jgi:dTDP-4-amino-4,6-dideoxygalactose transaminase
MYYLLMPSLDARTRFIAWLKDRGVLAVFHYLPLNKSEFARTAAKRTDLKKRWAETACPVTEDVSDRIIRLPFYTGMTNKEQAIVLDAILSWNAP